MKEQDLPKTTLQPNYKDMTVDFYRNNICYARTPFEWLVGHAGVECFDKIEGNINETQTS